MPLYTALIAEDELLVRIGIASCVPWNEMNIRVVAEVEDGKSAWEAYARFHPDLVVMDLRMPEMDGIELLRRIRQDKSDRTDTAQGLRQCVVIVVTNVEYSETLEKVRGLGVSGILLKASMRQEDIRNAVEKALRGFPEGPALAAEPSASEAWEKALLNNEKTIRLPFGARGLALMHLFPGERVSHRLRQSLTDLILHELGDIGKAVPVMTDTGAAFIFDKLESADRLVSLLEEMRHYIADNFYVQTGFQVCRESLSPEEVRSLFQFMKKLTSEPPFLREGILLLDTEKRLSDSNLQSLREKAEHFSALLPKATKLTDFCRALSLYPGELSDGWFSVRERGERVLRILKKEETPETLSAMTALLCREGEAFLERVAQSVKPELLTVIDYMNQHLGEELPIARVAALIGYQPKYFSRLFKNELGSNYSDFLTELRIREAEKMLWETRKSVQEIAEACGFSELSYFSTRFKLQTGMTPRQWREKK